MRGPRGGLILCKEAEAKVVNSRIFPGIQGGPLMHVIAGKAVAFGENLSPDFKDYAKQVIVNAQKLAETLLSRGYDLVTGGTDNHLMLVHLSHKNLAGKDAEEALDRAGITVNKNTVPNEKRSPFVTSGVRIGTPALTTRGMKEAEMTLIGNWIADVLDAPLDENTTQRVKGYIRELCQKYPLYA